MRLLLFREDYVGGCLVLTDCYNNELKTICEKVIENDENGKGESLTEICENLFPTRTMYELIDSENCLELLDLEIEYLENTYCDYVGFCKIIQ